MLGERRHGDQDVFFFNDTATTEIYALSLHDALPISTTPPKVPKRMSSAESRLFGTRAVSASRSPAYSPSSQTRVRRSEEHTSALQSRQYLVCRLLLEKKRGRERFQEEATVSKNVMAT